MPLCNEILEKCSTVSTTLEDVGPSEETKQILEELRLWVAQERGRQAELARHLGVYRSTVNEWIKGKTIPNWQTGRKLEQFLKSQRARRPKQP